MISGVFIGLLGLLGLAGLGAFVDGYWAEVGLEDCEGVGVGGSVGAVDAGIDWGIVRGNFVWWWRLGEDWGEGWRMKLGR